MKITELKGIGEKYAQLLGRLSVYTVEDLVGLYPRDYELYQEPAFISTLSPDYENTNVVIDGVVSKKIDVYHTGKLAVISTFINDENGDRIKCTWFNMPFLKSSLKLGMRYIFRGRFVIKNGIKILEQPQMYTRSHILRLKEPCSRYIRLQKDCLIKRLPTLCIRHLKSLMPDWRKNTFQVM